MTDQSTVSHYPDGISVVIPTEGRASLLDHLLQTLDKCRMAFPLPVEILVIDSSESQEQAMILESCKAICATYLTGPANVREKRNIGIRQAQYCVILFLDSDVRPGEQILEHHWSGYQRQEGKKVGGVLGLIRFEGPESWAWRNMISSSSLLSSFGYAEHLKNVVWGPTANISYLHEVLDQIGGFDTKFPFRLGCDDADLGYRVTQLGYTIVSSPGAIVYHTRSTWNNPWSVIKRSFRWGRMQYFLFKKHPAARIPSPPSLWGWAILVSIVLASQAVYFTSPRLLMLIPLWFVLSMAFYSLIDAVNGVPLSGNLIHRFYNSLLVSIPELPYSLGTTVEFVRHLDPRFLWSRIALDSTTIKDTWISESWNVWANLIAMLICQNLVFLWK